MSKESINSKDFLIGTLIGGIVGATTALFLAPKSGKELRENIGQQATVVKERTGKITNDALERGSEFANLAKEKTATISQSVSEQSNQLLNKVKDIRKASNNQTNDSEVPTDSAADELADEASKSLLETDQATSEKQDQAPENVAEATEEVKELEESRR
ncbi:YtxH domain-containing protein [Metabacillus arenae]|uniref:YtxH domain-containing protein n=1 Tax=Metabacillus arenae TaxID=2771434 RepID=A0A926NLS3_9BACI|nr:YtxH domain-containing protein [Metabacillus arenae]MBD1380151.1 YtxH domain-containing protein [Metabacillus arenae]